MESSLFEFAWTPVGKLLSALTPSPSDPAVVRHRERGKLFVRERIDLILDPGSPFLEIGALAGTDLYEGVRPGAGIVTGIGLIHGRRCMIVANDATVKGGSYYPLTVKKHLRAQRIAMECHLPCIYLVDSGGAFLPMQAEVFPDREHFGRIFFHQATMSAAGIPQIAVVMGSCTAGGAYVPAMCDETIIVEDQGTIFLGGPPLVKAATGEVISAEALGGGDVHTRLSGVADHLAKDDGDAIAKARAIVATLPPPPPSLRTPSPAAPPIEGALAALIPGDSKTPLPMRSIIRGIVDRGELTEFKERFGTTLICGFATIEGQPCGVIANDGILFSESALKGAHFIQLCEQRKLPLLFLQNIVGFMVGKEYEHRGIAKDGAKLVTAVACASVPKITIVVGGSFGAGNYAMCGRAYDPTFLFMWPTARIGVMGPQQAASVLTEIRRESALAKGKPLSDAEAATYSAEIASRYEGEAHALYSSARLWDDGIIHPDQTRRVVSLALGCVAHLPQERAHFGIFRM